MTNRHRRLATALFALGLSLVLVVSGCATSMSKSPQLEAPGDAEDASRPPATVAATTSVATSTPSPIAAASPTPAAGQRSVTIAAIGDIMLDRDVEALIAEHGAGYPWARVVPLFDGADIVLGNLEGTLTARGTAASKRYTFRTDPQLAGTLTAGGIDIVTLANNHTTDFGDVGLEDTIATLDALGVAHFGAGPDGEAARTPLVRSIDGTTIAFLGYADIVNTRFADDRSAGVARADIEAIEADVSAAAAANDFVVVTFHTGIEYTDAPSAHQRSLARVAVEAGADLVIGHHPHVLQPWERLGDSLILYSLGNFVFDLDADDLATLGTAPFLSGVALITLSPDAPPEVTLRPAFIDPIENRPRPASAEEAAAAQARFRELLGE